MIYYLIYMSINQLKEKIRIQESGNRERLSSEVVRKIRLLIGLVAEMIECSHDQLYFEQNPRPQ